jgi:hypothetical protein
MLVICQQPISTEYFITFFKTGAVSKSDEEGPLELISGLRMTDLPPEILENIFSYLHPGKATNDHAKPVFLLMQFFLKI